MAGKKVRCPACQNVLRVPADIAAPILEAEPVTDLVHSPNAPVPAKKSERPQDSPPKAKSPRRLSRAVVWFCVFLAVSGLGTCGTGAAVFVWKFLGSVDRVMIGKWELDKEETAKINPRAAAIPGGLVYEFDRNNNYLTLDGETGSWNQIEKNGVIGATDMLILMTSPSGGQKDLRIQTLPDNKLLFKSSDGPSGLGRYVMRRVDENVNASGSAMRMAKPPDVQPHRRFDILKQKGFHAIEALSLSDDGKRAILFAWAPDHTLSIQVWDLESAKILAAADQWRPIIKIAMAPDGKTAAIAYTDEIALIDVNSGTFHLGALKRSLWPKAVPQRLSFSAKGDLLFLGSPLALEVWDVKSRTLRHSIQLPEDTRVHRWSPLFADNRKIAFSKEKSNEIEIRDLETGKITGSFVETQFQPMATMCLSPDGKKLAIGDSGIWVFGLDDLKLVHFIPRGGEAVFVGGSKTLAYSWVSKIVLIDLESGQKRAALAGLTEPPHCMDVTPDGRFLVATARDATLLLWDLKKIP
jgi:hypothetical protein